MRAAFEPLLSDRDRILFADPVIGNKVIASIREGLRQGTGGAGWDNVSNTPESVSDNVGASFGLSIGHPQRVPEIASAGPRPVP